MLPAVKQGNLRLKQEQLRKSYYLVDHLQESLVCMLRRHGSVWSVEAQLLCTWLAREMD